MLCVLWNQKNEIGSLALRYLCTVVSASQAGLMAPVRSTTGETKVLVFSSG
ncbi:MAG: hypothetical protein ACKPKO_60740 [Candidatus Fonsibacter sp.]